MGENRFAVGVLGATGAVGQKLVTLLAGHPWFELVSLVASSRSRGKRYGEAAHWLESRPPEPKVAAMRLEEAVDPLACDLVISALDADTAQVIEPTLARAGLPVFSNASSHRGEAAVPLLVPEVNAEHLELVRRQQFGDGFIVANPNCSVAGLVLALKPLVDAFGVEAVQVTTMQALSGAGYPGVPALDAVGNVIPHIEGEDEKIENEPRKIFGTLGSGGVELHHMVISAQANRVPVPEGHLLSVAVRLGCRAKLAEVREALDGFASPIVGLGLPSAPPRPLEVCDDPSHPQPRLHATSADGMMVRIGRLRRCPVLDVRFVALVHNTVRGAAGAALLNAELAVRQGFVRRREGRARTALTPLAAFAW